MIDWRKCVTLSTKIHPDKIEAYLATNYRIDSGATPIVLRIGVRSEPLAQLFYSQGVDCGAFLTAWNPMGVAQSDAANSADHARLVERVAKEASTSLPGSGCDPTGSWPPELSVFAVGLPLATARQIGSEFRQDAIVWVGQNAVPELVLLR